MGDVVVPFLPNIHHRVICKFFNAPGSRSVLKDPSRAHLFFTYNAIQAHKCSNGVPLWLFVSNIPAQASKNDLLQALTPLSKILDVDFRRDRPFQFVQVPCEHAASGILAAARYDKIILQGRSLVVQERVSPLGSFACLVASVHSVDAGTQTVLPSDDDGASSDDAQTQTSISATNLLRHVRVSSDASDREESRRVYTKRAASAPRCRCPSPVHRSKSRSAFTSPTRSSSTAHRAAPMLTSPVRPATAFASPSTARRAHRRTHSHHADEHFSTSPKEDHDPQQSQASLTVLPDDMLHLIFSYMDAYQLVDVEQVCSLWYKLATSHWRRLVLEKSAVPDETNMNWRRFYHIREATRFDSLKLDSGGVLSEDRLSFTKRATNDKDWDQPTVAYGEMLMRVGRRYFEVRVREGVKLHIGVVARRTGKREHVGDQAEGFAFVSRTGHLMAGGDVRKYAAPWKRGDRVGCLIDMDANRLEFFVNGQSQGIAFSGQLPTAGVYAAVSVDAANDHVEIVLGARPHR